MKKQIARIIIIMGALFVNLTQTQAQLLGEKIIMLQGRITDVNGNPISYAYIVNPSKRQSTISDTAGFFKMPILLNDTIVISSIGYEKKKFNLPEKNVPKDFYAEISLKLKVYEIPTIDIYEARWQDFVYEFTHTKMQETIEPNELKNWIQSLITPQELAMLAAKKSVPGFTINLRSKSEREWKKRKKLEEKDQQNQEIRKKYNAEIIAQTTQFSGYKLLDFIQFCKIPRTFLETANEYQIINEIKRQQKIFEKKYTNKQ